MGPAFGVDRHARGAERLDIAMDGPLRDLELARQHGRGGATAGLEEEEELDQS